MRDPPEYVLSRFVAALGREGRLALESVLDSVDCAGEEGWYTLRMGGEVWVAVSWRNRDGTYSSR